MVLAISTVMIGCGGSFHSRVQAGKQALRTPAGKVYEKSLAPTIGRAMRECLPPGSPPQYGGFTVVADVNMAGTVMSVKVEPSTTASRCFAEKISMVTLPAPPLEERGFELFPVTIEMQVVP